MPKLDVSVAGEINLDIVFYGLPVQLPVERELLAKNSLLTLGSSSAIFAHNLAVMGTSVGFVTRVGSDPLGQLALDRLREVRVDLRAVIRSKGASTTGLTVILPHSHVRHIFTYPGAMFEMSYRDLDLAYLTNAQHFHMSSFFLHRALRDDIPRLFHKMKKAGLTTSLDTNDDPEGRWDGALRETLKHVDVLLPNRREAAKIARAESFEKLAQHVPVLVIKLGPRGAVAFHKGKRISAQAVQIKAIDPIGAGDSFDAGFLHQFVRGASIEKCLRWGNLAGAFSTTQPGGTEAFRNPTQWGAFLRRHRG